MKAWPRTVLRGNARASDSDAENELLRRSAAEVVGKFDLIASGARAVGIH